MESKFINKNNLIQLNSILSNRLNLQNKSKEEKKEVINSLLNNMKKVYNKLDKTKITANNLPKILDTFNKYSINNTINELKTDTIAKNRINVAESQFKRNHELHNNSNVTLSNRPEFTTMPRERDNDLTSRNINFGGKPINSYHNIEQSNTRYSKNIPRNMEDLVKQRRDLVPEIQKPPTPDFLKATKVKENKEEQSHVIENFNNSFSSEDKSNFSDSRMQGDTYHLNGVNQDSNFSSINFGNDNLSSGLPEIDETVNTSQRLEQMQKERANMMTNTENFVAKPDFSKSISENEMEKRQMQQHNQMQEQMQQEQMQQQQQQMHQQMQQEQIMQQQQIMQQKQLMQQQQMMQQQMNNKLNKASNVNNGNIIDSLNHINREDVLKLLNTYAGGNNSIVEKEPEKLENVNKSNVNSDINEYLNDLGRKQVEQLKQVQQMQEQLQMHLQKQMLNPTKSYSESDNDIGTSEIHNELISKVKILTGQLEEAKKINIQLQSNLEEMQLNKASENDRKISIINEKRNEIKKEISSLGKKHKEIESLYTNLINKEKFISALLEKNRKILQINKDTLFLNSKNYGYKTNINYNFDNEIKKVNRIELISYEFPVISNNINDTNNILHYKINMNDDKSVENEESNSEQELIDDDEDIITVPNGNYDISTLIKKLNKISNGLNLIFSYNKNTSKVTIRHKQDIPFNLYFKDNSILQKLGFNERELLDNHIYVSENSYNLQKSNYVYIYLSNIQDDSMANVNINFNKQGSYFIDVDEINLDKLNIEIRDESNKLIDFCNLSFKLEFNIYYTDETIKLDDNVNLSSLINSDDDSNSNDESLKSSDNETDINSDEMNKHSGFEVHAF